jgi:hypothetical protein
LVDCCFFFFLDGLVENSLNEASIPKSKTDGSDLVLFLVSPLLTDHAPTFTKEGKMPPQQRSVGVSPLKQR